MIKMKIPIYRTEV